MVVKTGQIMKICFNLTAGTIACYSRPSRIRHYHNASFFARYTIHQPKKNTMKVLKKILLVIAIIIAIPLVIALFVKKDYAVERSVTINKPKAEVFNYIRYLKNQDNYSVWANMDPAMHKEYRGTDGTPGFVSAWSSTQKDVGKGEQEIKKIAEGERIDFELRFIEPFASTAPAYMATQAVSGNQTNVKWGFSGHMGYPTNIMLLFMNMEDMIGKDLETGLHNLKAILEKQ